jgi:ATP-binding cassette subfamily C (CFTR/MRP) protein 2
LEIYLKKSCVVALRSTDCISELGLLVATLSYAQAKLLLTLSSRSLSFWTIAYVPANAFAYIKEKIFLSNVESTTQVTSLAHPSNRNPTKATGEMELLASSKHGLSILFSRYYSSPMYSGTDFLLKPVFLRGVSGSLHLVLLFVLFISWVCKKLKVGRGEGPKGRFKTTRGLYYKLPLICSLGVSVFSLVLCLLNYFYWYRNGWSDEGLVALLDLAVRALAWGALCVYFRTQLFNSGSPDYPFLLRVWWGFYLFISCYCLVIDIVLHRKHVNVSVQYFVSDIVSVVTGLFFCYLGFFRNNEGEDTLLKEPLLNGDSTASDKAESNKCKGGDTVTPYSNAGIFSILTFSWMGPLIAAGNKKTLDLEDVPQLDPGDSVVRSFPTFRNKLEVECGTYNRMTTLKLVKALISSVWIEILLTALLVVIYALASYVGPFLLTLLFNTSMVEGSSRMRAILSFQCFLLQNLWNASRRGTGSLGCNRPELKSDQY